MAATGAPGGEFFRCSMDGCLSNFDGSINHRPYHRNCNCQLHKQSRNNRNTNNNCPSGNCNGASKKGSLISYPIRRAWSEGSLLSMVVSPASSPGGYGYVSPSNNHLAEAAGGGGSRIKNQSQFQGLSSDDDDLIFSNKF